MIYVLYGPEKYELYRFVDSVKSSFDTLENGINYFNINLDNIKELDSIYNSMTFFSSNKLVIIKDTKLKFDVTKLLLEADEEDTYIIIEDSLDKRLSVYKELSKKAQVKEFKELTPKEMISYLVTTFKKYKLSMNSSVAEYMVLRCGIDKSNIINEMKKIVSLKDINSVITKEDIDNICSKTFTTKIFDMLDFAVNKNKKDALKMLDELIIQKEPVVKISIMLYKQIKQMYIIKYMKVNNMQNANEILKLNPYVFNKLSSCAHKYELDKLKLLIYKFGEYDEKTKIGLLDFEIGLKQIICLM